MRKSPFTFRQEEFCRLYAAGMAATSAALHAGYAPSTAQSQAARLLRSIPVQNCIRMHRYGHQLIQYSDYQQLAQKLLGITHRGTAKEIILATRELTRILKLQTEAKSFPVQASFGLQEALRTGLVPQPGQFPDDPEIDEPFLDLPALPTPHLPAEHDISSADYTTPIHDTWHESYPLEELDALFPSINNAPSHPFRSPGSSHSPYPKPPAPSTNHNTTDIEAPQLHPQPLTNQETNFLKVGKKIRVPKRATPHSTLSLALGSNQPIRHNLQRRHVNHPVSS